MDAVSRKDGQEKQSGHGRAGQKRINGFPDEYPGVGHGCRHEHGQVSGQKKGVQCGDHGGKDNHGKHDHSHHQDDFFGNECAKEQWKITTVCQYVKQTVTAPSHGAQDTDGDG